jgi:phosphate starvation-inducible membrane PsiE
MKSRYLVRNTTTEAEWTLAYWMCRCLHKETVQLLVFVQDVEVRIDSTAATAAFFIYYVFIVVILAFFSQPYAHESSCC